MNRRSIFVSVLALAASCALGAAAQDQRHAQTVQQLTGGPGFQRATAALRADHDRWVRDIITLTEIPAPPFKEQARAAAYARMFREVGLAEVKIDKEGNVLGLRRGTERRSAPATVVVVSAHLDTVFPEGSSVKVRREGDRLYAPGVGDDSTGLATILTLVRAMNAGGLRTRGDILFVGTVGEEGAGDLRGVRHLFNEGQYKDRIGAFFSIDGTGLGRIVTGGVGSKRYRVTFKGPGGHSYGAFGIVNPMAALGRATTEFYKTEVPATPKTTYSISVLGGGTSVNSIPNEAWMEVDMRSVSANELAKLERHFLTVVSEAVAAENAARSTRTGAVTAEPKLIGDRPAGSTAETADIVRYAEAAHAEQGVPVERTASSTDSNLAMSLGVPAVTISRAAEGDRTHSLDEWVGVAPAPNLRVKTTALATILAVAGVHSDRQ